MILQALTRLFEDLTQRGDIPKPGWSPSKISFALSLDEAGTLKAVVPLLHEEPVGKTKKLFPTPMVLPSPVHRKSNVAPNFLWDNSGYLLGVDAKGKPERSRSCFLACGKLHHRLLDGVDSPTA